MKTDLYFLFLASAPPPQAYQQPQYAGGYPAGPPEQAYPQSQGPAPSHGGLLSNCQGNKKALLIGINYFGQSGELRGCVNDVNNIKQLIMSRGFRESNMMILTDDQRDPRCHPTRQNIIEGKVEKILKGSLDWIPSASPSVKIQIVGGKICLRCKGKPLLGACLYISNNNLNFH